MRRIFWDSMLLIYLLEGHSRYSERVEELLSTAYLRDDKLFTSYLGLGEVLAGASKAENPAMPGDIQAKLVDAGFSFLPFGESAVGAFAHLRTSSRVKSADAINLACAASARIDLFLTGDRELYKLHVPGIHFIADFDSDIL